MNNRNEYNKLKYRLRTFRVPIDSKLDLCLKAMENDILPVNRLITRLLSEYFKVPDPYENSSYYRVITDEQLL